MNELNIIKYIIINKDIYNNIYKYINKEYFKKVHPNLYKILLVVIDWYESGKDSFQSVNDFQAVFFTAYPALKRNEVHLYVELFKQLDSINLSEQVLNEVLEAHRMRYEATVLIDKGYAYLEGRETFSDLMDAYKRVSDEQPVDPNSQIEFVTDDLEELFNNTYGRPGLRWKLKTLNKMMGSLRKGDFGFLFARPEVGKTTFIADQCGYSATQGATVLHFNNEEDGRKVKLRYYQSILGLTSKELFGDFQNNRQRFTDLVGDRVRLLDRSTFSRGDIEQVIEATNPSIIVIDSIDKITGFKSDDTPDGVYKRIYAWARQLAKDFAPVIGVCHASVTGEGKKFLEMDDVAYAKTAKQGEADWILGIGKSNSPNESEFNRYLHLPKNKLMGDQDTEEALRHGKLPIRIVPELARYEDILEFNEDNE